MVYTARRARRLVTMRSKPITHSTRVLLALPLIVAASTTPAWSDPWIPAARHGTAKSMVRLFSGNSSFPSSGFSSTAVPSTKQSSTQLRLDGTAGLGQGLALDYDLRWGHIQTSGKGSSATSSGLQDEEIGLGYGLIQRPGFADALTLNLVVPAGQTKPGPAQGTGRWALEPDFEVGLHDQRFSASLLAGTRIFMDGNATQLRAELNLSARATQRLTITGSVFFADTPQSVHTLPPGAAGEIYNVLRLGAGVEYRLTNRFRPYFIYEANVAGRGIHAGNRLTFGIAVKY